MAYATGREIEVSREIAIRNFRKSLSSETGRLPDQGTHWGAIGEDLQLRRSAPAIDLDQDRQWVPLHISQRYFKLGKFMGTANHPAPATAEEYRVGWEAYVAAMRSNAAANPQMQILAPSLPHASTFEGGHHAARSRAD